MGVITVQDLKPGMITAAPVKTKAGQLIIGKNTVLTESLITRMSFYNIQSVSVIDMQRYRRRRTKEDRCTGT